MVQRGSERAPGMSRRMTEGVLGEFEKYVQSVKLSRSEGQIFKSLQGLICKYTLTSLVLLRSLLATAVHSKIIGRQTATSTFALLANMLCTQTLGKIALVFVVATDGLLFVACLMLL